MKDKKDFLALLLNQKKGGVIREIAITSWSCTFTTCKYFIQVFVWFKRSTVDQSLLSQLHSASITLLPALWWVCYNRRNIPWICHSWTGILWRLGSLDWCWMCCYHAQHLTFDHSPSQKSQVFKLLLCNGLKTDAGS